MNSTPPLSIYDIDCTDLSGQTVSLKHFSGRPMLIVNTASLCGFSEQFTELEALWQRHKDEGLLVMAVPSNDFGRQEPGSSPEIMSICTAKFGISFPLLQKARVTGPDAHPLFKRFGEEGGFLARPRWNFYKYIVGRDGHLKDWFSSWTSPKQGKFQRALSEAIAR